MKVYRVMVTDGKNRNSWVRFCNYVDATYGREKTDDEKIFWKILEEEYHIIDEPDTPYIWFKSEEDALAFLLRW